MITKHKIVSLTVVGLVLGGVVGALALSEPWKIFTLTAACGGIGFLAGWIWNNRSAESEI